MNWQIWIDTGGTFTDCLARDPEGKLQRLKILSSACIRGTLLDTNDALRFRISTQWGISDPIFEGYRFRAQGFNARVRSLDPLRQLLELDQPLPSLQLPCDFELSTGEEPPVLAARLITRSPLHSSLPNIDMKLGTTKGTNALLEKKGAPVTLITTRGFGDLLYIGTQQRPDLFQPDIPEPELLHSRVIEVEERIDATGKVLTPLSLSEIKRIQRQLSGQPDQVVAVALLNAYRNPEHENRIGAALTELGLRYISLSAQLSPSIQLLPRTQTAVVNSYLSPLLDTYLGNIRMQLPGGALQVMNSQGGLNRASQFHPKDSLLSGPAGGVAGAARIARQMGFPNILTLDMGGTSTDTARFDGRFDYQYHTRIGSIQLASPSLSIETVAAGGGSICAFDGYKLCVGPDSAGASPGPACYGAGGPLTITDVNLLLGKLDPAAMGIPVDIGPAERALAQLREDIFVKTGAQYSYTELLHGFERIANEKMADAIRKISVARGFDPSAYALLVFGGAGGLHGCEVARLLGIDTLLLPYDAGLLSAYGIGNAQIRRMAEQQVLQLLEACRDSLPGLLAQLSTQATGLVISEGIAPDQVEIENVLFFLRFRGQDSSLEIPCREIAALEADFKAHYTTLFGHYPVGRPIEVESIRVLAASRERESARAPHSGAVHAAIPARYHPSPMEGPPCPVYDWDLLSEGAYLNGPGILLNPYATTYIPDGWNLQIKKDKNALLKCISKPSIAGSHREAIELELFTNRFRAIAEEMGAQLRRTAFSVNIKERLDFSCALLDPQAELLVNAPHIPVHLGSLGVCARLILQALPLGPGDVIVTNHPKYGGSHLPDVTLLSAVFDEEGQLIGYVINRAHHAEIGGSRPGSMPPDAACLAEEGVVIPPTYLVRCGEVQWSEMEQPLTCAPYPTRALPENMADLNAALAALRSGSAALQALVRENGLEKVHRYMKRLKDSAHHTLADALVPYAGQTYEAEEFLDDGHRIRVAVAVSEDGISFDFSGTSPVHPGNLNANLAIVHSTLLYVLRLICNQDIPLNEGLMRSVRIHLPVCFLNPDFQDDPLQCPAVVGGNTEVSQRLTDTLLKAFGLSACSQGTMNNFLFGNDRFGYYETIGGGAGAGPGFHGRSAVHQHMTNTQITDPEILEWRYPVRLLRFAIRKGSGGAGQWRGGDGIVREMEFLEPVALTFLSQHRKVAPYGMQGGAAGLTGTQYLIRAHGAFEALQGIDSRELEIGDRVVIETPGGGGWGNPDTKKNSSE